MLLLGQMPFNAIYILQQSLVYQFNCIIRLGIVCAGMPLDSVKMHYNFTKISYSYEEQPCTCQQAIMEKTVLEARPRGIKNAINV